MPSSSRLRKFKRFVSSKFSSLSSLSPINSKKAQFFILTTFAIVSIIFFMSRWMEAYTITDTSTVVLMDDIHIFNNIVSKAEYIINFAGEDWEELNASLHEYKDVVENYGLAKNLEIVIDPQIAWGDPISAGTITVEVISPTISAKRVMTVSRDFTLVGFWRFDEKRGALSRDYSGYENDATLNGLSAFSWLDGEDCVMESCLSLDGSGDYINTSYYSSNEWDEITVVAWVYNRQDKFGADPEPVVCKSDGTEASNAVFCLGTQSDQVSFRMSTDGTGGGTTDALSSGSVIGMNNWYFIAATWDSSDEVIRFYVNGNPAGNAFSRDGDTLRDSVQPVVVGNNMNGGDRYLNARVDNVRVFSRALAPLEIENLYILDSGQTPPDTCAEQCLGYTDWTCGSCPGNGCDNNNCQYGSSSKGTGFGPCGVQDCCCYNEVACFPNCGDRCGPGGCADVTCEGIISVSNDDLTCGASQFIVTVSNTGSDDQTVDIHDEIWTDPLCNGVKGVMVDNNVWTSVNLPGNSNWQQSWTSSLTQDGPCYLHTIFYCTKPLTPGVNPCRGSYDQCWEEAYNADNIMLVTGSGFTCNQMCTGTISVSNDDLTCGASAFTVSVDNTGSDDQTVDIYDEIWTDPLCNGVRGVIVDSGSWTNVNLPGNSNWQQSWTSSAIQDGVCYLHTIFYCSKPFDPGSNSCGNDQTFCYQEADLGNIDIGWTDSAFTCNEICSGTISVSNDGLACGASDFTVTVNNAGVDNEVVDIYDRLYTDPECDGWLGGSSVFVDDNVWSNVNLLGGSNWQNSWSTTQTSGGACYVHRAFYCSKPYLLSNPCWEWNFGCQSEADAGNIALEEDFEFACTLNCLGTISVTNDDLECGDSAFTVTVDNTGTDNQVVDIHDQLYTDPECDGRGGSSSQIDSKSWYGVNLGGGNTWVGSWTSDQTQSGYSGCYVHTIFYCSRPFDSSNACWVNGAGSFCWEQADADNIKILWSEDMFQCTVTSYPSCSDQCSSFTDWACESNPSRPGSNGCSGTDCIYGLTSNPPSGKWDECPVGDDCFCWNSESCDPYCEGRCTGTGCTAYNVPDPVAHWKFDQSSGVSAPDSADGYDGTLVNMESDDWLVGGGVIGNGLEFNTEGTKNEYVRTADIDYGTSNRITVMAWVKYTSCTGSNAYCYIVAKHQYTSSSPYTLTVWNNRLGFVVRSSSSILASPLTYNDGQWHHVAATFNNGNAILYVDGNNVGSRSFTSISNNNELVTIGGDDYSPTYRPFQGVIDEVKIFNVVLSGPDISTIHTIERSYLP